MIFSTSLRRSHIAPSIALAREHLVAHSSTDWITEISTMIADHHKITPSTANSNSLVEPFRQADWIDVTGGLRRFSIPHRFVARLFATWPDAGFHRRLVQLALHTLRTHPLSPLPMGQTVMMTCSGADTLLEYVAPILDISV